ncbi:peptidyl-prolyl cis-trans isomerase [Holotrichia oblita]|uniref:Peptidyl-prolyl cis-trans isomerase n=1 Tax=Holotrichia oblita TaxID=644536 RepID=A0ACB9SVM0_HOLOL|nr:peptidyl-prolyl cis-trans isomerase [Holotrichia oblita]
MAKKRLAAFKARAKPRYLLGSVGTNIWEEDLKLYNRHLLNKPVYRTREYDRMWGNTIQRMAHMAKFTLQIFLDKSIDRVVQEMPPISGDLPKLKPRPLCYMDFRIKDGVYLGRIIIELYADYVPLTVENFLTLCKGVNGYKYKCCRIFNVVKGQYLETGDITMNNGKGGVSMYGDFFHEENFLLKHTKPGVLSMIRFGKNFNNSQFSITFDAQENLDGKRVVFGNIIKGMKTLYQIQDLGKKVGSPIAPIYIEKCGEIRKKKHKQNLLK